MSYRSRIPLREQVFIQSMMYHGFRKTNRRKDLKLKKGFIIPATEKEDSGGIDFWVKMPGDSRLLPVQITQRGVKLFRKFKCPVGMKLDDFIRRSICRVQAKRDFCKKSGIAFVLVRDHWDKNTNPRLAASDVQALRKSISSLKRWV